MAANKKKAQAKKSTNRKATTTVDSAPVDHGRTTIPSFPVKTKIDRKKTNTAPVPQRERRRNPAGRRGRHAEKTPAGTRTKMLKIIYDRKAEMERKRHQARIGKLVIGLVLAGTFYYGAQHLWSMAQTSTSAAIKWFAFDQWWTSVTSRPPQRSAKKTTKQIRTPKQSKKKYRKPPHKQRRPTARKRTAKRRHVQLKRRDRKRTYGSTKLYRHKKRLP